MDAEMELLNHWVLDEAKIITNSYVLRHTGLDVIQTQKLFEDFLSQNIANENVSATYYLLGEIASNDDDDDIVRKQSLVCKQADLEETKKKFSSLGVCTIYSVQAQSINDFNVLFNVNLLDSISYLSPTKEKTLVRNSTAISNYENWKKSHQTDEHCLDQATAKVSLNDKLKTDAKQKESEKMSKKIDHLFEKSIKTSPVKTSTLALSSPEKKLAKKKLLINEDSNDTASTAKAKKHKKSCAGAFISSDEDEGNGDEADASTSLTKMIATNNSEINNDDIYCTGDSSNEGNESYNIENTDEVMVNDGTSSSKKKKTGNQKTKSVTAAKGKKSKAKLIDCDSDNEENNVAQLNDRMEIDDENPLPKSNSSTIDKRQEKVTETYVDDDGFVVTQTVMRSVDNIRKEVKSEATPNDKADTDKKSNTPSASSNQVLKPSNSTNSTSKAMAKKKTVVASAAQPKISSFFTRKAE